MKDELKTKKQLIDELNELRAGRSGSADASVINASPVSIMVLGPDLAVTVWNDAAEKTFGWTRAEVLGKNCPVVPEDKLAEFQALVKKVMDGGSFCGVELRLNKRNNAPIDVSISAAPLRSPGGDVMGFMALLSDVTERKRKEEVVLRSKKLESIGILAGGIAHDFNNLLHGLFGSISLSKMYLNKDDKVYMLMEKAEDMYMQAKDLTTQLIAFSKGCLPVRNVSDLSYLIRNAVRVSLDGTDVKAEFSVPATLWPVEIDEYQIRQVIQHITANAKDAMSGSGKVVVSAENVTLGDSEVLPLEKGRYVRISIKDHGPGIPAENLSKIFDLYFTTKDQSDREGMGLGLSLCYSIIRKHDGLITVESEPGKGTALHIYIPASVKGDKSEKGVSKEKEEIGNILIMDDTVAVRDIAGEMLRHLGYDVGFAHDGAEAIEQFITAREAGRPYDLLLLDLTVTGGMGGQASMRRLREIDPNVKAIISSGYAEDPIMKEFSRYGFINSIIKPYGLEELREKISMALNNSSPK